MRHIFLSNGGSTLVSSEDFDALTQWVWSRDTSGYACRMQSFCVDGKRKRKKILMHRQIIGAPKGAIVDHINRTPLDNRRENLRLATHSQNCANSSIVRGLSRYKGVTYYRRDNKWRAELMVNRVHYTLGLYECEEDAAIARDIKALELLGEFAYLNHEELRPLYAQSLVTTRLHRSMPTIARG